MVLSTRDGFRWRAKSRKAFNLLLGLDALPASPGFSLERIRFVSYKPGIVAWLNDHLLKNEWQRFNAPWWQATLLRRTQ